MNFDRNPAYSPKIGRRERGPTMIVDSCKAAHRAHDRNNNAHRRDDIEINIPLSEQSRLLSSSQQQHNNGPMMTDNRRTVRFQVVVWYVGPVDVMLGHVSMKFRVTIFWNDVDNDETNNDGTSTSTGGGGGGMRRSNSFIVMKGRQQAHEQLPSDNHVKTFDVPPVSILNAVTFDVMGEPEVTLLRQDTKLMRWTCLYKAVLIQENMRVDKFPHDEHDLCLKLGFLEHRQRGARWDRTVWRLALATEDDSQKSTRVPYGLLVDHVKVPDFTCSRKGLVFEFVPLNYGAGDEIRDGKDQCLRVRLNVIRDSAYYDKNIMPLLGMLNICAISTLTLDADNFFKRCLMMLNITFVEIGIRMTVDSHLPSVGYQIKMQRILNHFFFGILFMVIESSILYFLIKRHGYPLEKTDVIDLIIGGIALLHVSCLLVYYYWDAYVSSKKKRALY